METMETEGSGKQSRRGSFSQRHEQFGRCNDERTPKTPCRDERTRNYDGISLNSGRSSGRRTPVSACEQRSFPPSPYEGGRSPKCRTVSHAKRNRRGVTKERQHTRETRSDRIKTYEAVDDSRYGTGSNSVSRRQSFQSTSSRDGPRQQSSNPSSGKGGTSRKYAEGKDRIHKEKQSQCYRTSTEDSACSIFRCHWNENINRVAKREHVETSEVSVVQRFVDTQSKALDKSGDIDEQGVKVFSEFRSKENVLTERKTVAAVLAFQRWRHTHLKRLFSLELKKVLEEAKEDEACLARLDQDLAEKSRLITQLRYQLSSYENASETQMVQRHAIDANIKELQSEMLEALQRAATAEEELHKRDCEIHKLKDRLVSLEDEGIRIDSELQSSLTKLHNDRESAVNESRVLLSQLSRRDEEVTSQCKEIDKLRATNAHLSARQANFQEEIQTLKSEHRDEVNILKKKLQHAFAARHSKELELVSYTEKCSGLDQERQDLLAQLHQALERADLASQRAEELQGKLHCTAEKRASASEDIAAEMVEQLKRLTWHMRELETSMDNTALRFPVSVFRKKAVVASLAKLSNKLAQAEVASLDILTHEDSLSEPQRSCPGKDDSRRQVYFSFTDERHKTWTEADSKPCHLEKENSIVNSEKDTALTKFKKGIAWKWRWAASAAKAENLSKQLRREPTTTVATDIILHQRQQEQIREKQLDVSEVDEMSDSEKKRTSVITYKLGNFFVKHKLVPVIMMAWRAFVRLSNLQRMASARNESLKKITSALPWWIRRVGERRAVERYFFNWRLLALRANRAKVQQQQQQQMKLSRSRPPYKLGANQPLPTASPVRLPSVIKTIYRDAESQTDTYAWLPGADKKQEKNSIGTKSIRQHPKSETKVTPPQVSKNEVRKKFRTDVLRLATTQETKHIVNSTAAVKPLRGFENPFQQELKEFQDTVSREMDSVDQIPVRRPHNTNGRITGTIEANPAKQALKSVFGVCNDLAQALSEVRAQLFGAENQTRNAQVWDAGGKAKRSSTNHPEVHGDGSKSRDKNGSRQPILPQTTNHYALPLGRVGRFKSPQRQQLGEASAPRSREGLSSSAYVPGMIGNPQPRTVWQPYGDSADELQYFQQAKDGLCRSTQGRREQQTVRRPSESARGLRQPARAEKAVRYDLRNAQVDPHPDGNTGGKYQHPHAGRYNTHQLRSGGLERRLLLSDTSRVGGGVGRSRTPPGNDDAGLGTSLFNPPPDCLHTTVVQILSQNNNKIGEVAIHTRPLNGGGGTGKAECVSREADSRSTRRVHSIKDESNDNNTTYRGGKVETPQESSDDRPRPSSAPGRSQDQCKYSVRPTSAPRFDHTSTSGRQNNNAVDRGPTMNFIASLRRKQCIGSDYADLLRAEIIRLREDRLSLEDKSLHTTFGERKDLPLIRRPGWRNF